MLDVVGGSPQCSRPGPVHEVPIFRVDDRPKLLEGQRRPQRDVEHAIGLIRPDEFIAGMSRYQLPMWATACAVEIVFASPQGFFDALALRDVAHRGEHTDDLADLISVNCGVIQDRGHVAVPVLELQGIIPHRAFTEDSLVARPCARAR